jgi:flagellar biosynthesis protein FlhA
VPVGEAEIFPDRHLAINPGRVFGTLQGVATRDPAFGLQAVWITPSERENAQTLGYTVVDGSTVVATHLSELLQAHANELIGHEEVQQLLDVLARTAPKLVEDLIPGTLTLGVVLKVLQNLLEERIPVRDMRTIAEALAETGSRSQDPGALTAAVRIALGRSIVQHINGMSPEVQVITLDPALEQILQTSIHTVSDGGAGIEPGLAERMHRSLVESVHRQEAAGQPSILLVTPSIRPWLAKLVRHSIPGLQVLAYNEIPDNKQIKVVANIGTDTPSLGAQRNGKPAV